MTPLRAEELTGRVYGRLTVLRYHHSATNGAAYWECRCECGKLITTRANRLKSGTTTSCGCYAIEQTIARSYKHGYSSLKAPEDNQRTYGVWTGILDRCTNKDNPNYKHYGGRGITVVPEWQDFLTFVQDMGLCKEGYSIERVDVNKGYSPDNCIWLLRNEQGKNRTTSIIVEVDGQSLCLKDACKAVGLPYHTVRYHVVKGKPFAEVVTSLRGNYA